MLETACRQARAWQDQGLPRFSVAVNVSPRQFERQSIVALVADVLDRTGLDPTLLELEVTESVLVEHVEDTAASLAELRAMGVRCSIDDFGTGYSALTYLTQIPADAIKIDPSFVRRIDSESEAAPIVGAVIALAHSLNLPRGSRGRGNVSPAPLSPGAGMRRDAGLFVQPGRERGRDRGPPAQPAPGPGAAPGAAGLPGPGNPRCPG